MPFESYVLVCISLCVCHPARCRFLICVCVFFVLFCVCDVSRADVNASVKDLIEGLLEKEPSQR